MANMSPTQIAKIKFSQKFTNLQYPKIALKPQRLAMHACLTLLHAGKFFHEFLSSSDFFAKGSFHMNQTSICLDPHLK